MHKHHMHHAASSVMLPRPCYHLLLLQSASISMQGCTQDHWHVHTTDKQAYKLDLAAILLCSCILQGCSAFSTQCWGHHVCAGVFDAVQKVRHGCCSATNTSQECCSAYGPKSVQISSPAQLLKCRVSTGRYWWDGRQILPSAHELPEGAFQIRDHQYRYQLHDSDQHGQDDLAAWQQSHSQIPLQTSVNS